MSRDYEPEVFMPKTFSISSEQSGPVDLFNGTYSTRIAQIEAFTAAYLKMTDIPPQEAELVEVREQGRTRWYFRKRDS